MILTCADSFIVGAEVHEDIHAQREQLKKIIKGSIIEEQEAQVEEEEKANFKLIYQSNVKNISGLPTKDVQRTTSFHENLNGDEFKKESKGFIKKMQQLSTTQKFFSRKQQFTKKASVKKPQQKLQARLTQNDPENA